MSPALSPSERRGLTWRLALATVLGAGVYGGLWAFRLSFGAQVVPTWLLWVDPVLGVIAVTALVWRRRHPLAVSLFTLVLTAVSGSAIPAALVALTSLATRRRWRELALDYAVALAAGMASEYIVTLGDPPSLLTAVVLQTSAFAAFAGVGVAIGAQRETVVSLREQVAVAQRERASRVAEVQATERARIAREMHDVLAHRISLIAVHAGALSYRTDLAPEQVRSTAELVRDNADRAVAELREVLGVLRTEADTESRRPQPTLAALPELLAEVRAAGTRVEVETVLDPASRIAAPLTGLAAWQELPERLSRHTYRVVQEGLTNARKHAPGMPVTVQLRGTPGLSVEFTVRNPAAPYGPPSVTAAASGMGLVGLTERVTRAGGRISSGYDQDGCFVLHGSLPWEQP